MQEECEKVRKYQVTKILAGQSRSPSLKEKSTSMSNNGNRNSLLLSNNRYNATSAAKEKLLSMKYLLDQPSAGIYPLDTKTKEELTSERGKLSNNFTYPDFQPWKDHTQLPPASASEEEQRMENSMHLNKGLFEAPQVSNEYYSARNLIQTTIFSSSENCAEVLKELSQHLASVYKTRNEIINKINYDSNNFKLPPKVTLTSLKRDAWIKDLADPSIPLSVVSKRLPHGIKNKVLLDILCSKLVPNIRALWFTKCVLYSDALLVRKKFQMKLNQAPNIQASEALLETHEVQWLQEWTQQVIDYVYRFSREVNNVNTMEKKQDTSKKLNYLMNYIQTLYIESLVDKDLFLTLIIRFFKDGLLLDNDSIIQFIIRSKSEFNDNDSDDNNYNDDFDKLIKNLDINYGQRLVALNLVKIFWLDIIKLEYLCKDLSEVLLLNYYFIEKLPISVPKLSRPSIVIDHLLSPDLKQGILNQISRLIQYLFKLNSNIFIIPNYWILVGEVLYKILLANSSHKEQINNTKDKSEKDDQQTHSIQKQLQLILYRNESLMLSMKHGNTSNTKEDANISLPFTAGHRRTGSFPNNFPSFETTFNSEPFASHPSTSITSESTNLESIENEIYINRKNDDIFKIIDYLDKSKLNEELAELIRPSFDSSNFSASNDRNWQATDWKLNLSVVVLWCITKYRESSDSNETILMVCGFFKNILMKSDNVKTSTKIKTLIEDSLLDILFTYSDNDVSEINVNKLFVLFNELYQLKIIAISAYLRKLIASGIFYLPPGEKINESYILNNSQVNLHLQILKNLPVLKNKQSENILKKFDIGHHFNPYGLFEQGKEILNEEIVEKFKVNRLITYNFKFFESLPVGIKYLLINWITDEFKSIVMNSTKLIHIKLPVIIKLYKFYSISDNLTVFFRNFVKNILKNESRIIILDLDVLYVLSKLIIKHFKLIKTLSNSESNLVGYELFKLIYSNYRDLTVDEYDYFNFRDIWQFISKSIEISSSSRDENDYNKDQEIKLPIPQYIYSKNTVDSPMKLNSSNGNDTNVIDNSESIGQFLSELTEHINKPVSFLKPNEIHQILRDLKLSDELVSDYNNNCKKIILILFDYCFKYYDKLNESQETELVKLLVNTKATLINNEGAFAFFECFNFFITKALGKVQQVPSRSPQPSILESIEEESTDQQTVEIIKGNENILGKLKFTLKRLIIFDIIDLTLIYTVFQSVSNNLEIPVNYNSILVDLVIGVDENKDSAFFLLLELNRESFMKNNMIFEILSREPIEHYNNKIFNFFGGLIFKKSRRLFENLLKFKEQQITEILNRVLDKRIENFQDLFVAGNLNVHEFNLSLYQLLLRLIIQKDFKYLTNDEKLVNLESLVMNILNNLNIKFSYKNSYFGELFSLLPINEKINISKIIESLLFKTLKFENNSFTCKFNGTNNNGVEIDYLPVFYDYFKKFSVSSVDIEINQEFFNNLLVYSNQLNSFNSEAYSESFDYLLSIFLRILIIHKNSIINFIMGDEIKGIEFSINLKNLLDCQQLQSPAMEKLKILLYDLLLIFKNLILQHISKTSKDLTDTSDPVHPTINLIPTNNNTTPTNATSTPGTTVNPDGSRLDVQDILPDFTKYEKLLSILDLPDFFNNDDNSLHQYLDDSTIKSAMMLTRDELEQGGDYQQINNSNLVLTNKSIDTFSPFNLLSELNHKNLSTKFKIKSFEILEDTSHNLNDGRINLLLFDAYTTKQNPP